MIDLMIVCKLAERGVMIWSCISVKFFMWENCTTREGGRYQLTMISHARYGISM